MTATTTETATPPSQPTPYPPQVGNCPAGGSHAPIPVQSENFSVCAKCGARC